MEGICTSPGAAESSTLFGTNASKATCEPCVSQFEVVMSHDINDDKDYLHRHDFKSLPFLGKREGGVLNATSSLESQDEEYTNVKDLLVMSGLTEEASSGIINEMGIDDVCTETEDHFQLKGLMTLENREPGSRQERIYKLGVDQQLLFDCVNGILQRQIEPILSPQPWGARDLGRPCAGQPLVQQVWDVLQDLQCPLADAYNALYIILQKDFTRKEFQWLDFSVEIGEVGFQLADLVFKETLEAAMQDVTVMCTAQKCFPPQPPLLPPPPAEGDDDTAEKRRQELVEKTRRDLLAWHVQYQKV